MLAVACVAGVVAVIVVGGLGFLCGVDAAAQLFAAAWLERHPDEGDLTLNACRRRS